MLGRNIPVCKSYPPLQNNGDNRISLQDKAFPHNCLGTLPQTDDGDLVIYVPFNIIYVIVRHWVTMKGST